MRQNPQTLRLQPRAARRAPAVQAALRDPSNDNFARKFQCSTCRIAYDVPRGQKAQCPLCQASAEVAQMREALLEMKNKLEAATNELNRLRPQVDLVLAMRDALDLIGVEDRTFLKSVAYRYRAGEAVTLHVTMAQTAGRRGRVERTPNGFLAKCPTGNEAHHCTSIGGLALAQYTRESLATVGPVTTMQHVMRALSGHLTPTGS
jgi:hypothetical protein